MDFSYQNQSNSSYGNNSISLNTSNTENVLSVTETWFFETWICISVIFAILGNIGVIVQHFPSRHVKQLILNRAIANICVSILHVPLTMIILSTQTWMLPDFLCVIYRLNSLFLMASVQSYMCLMIQSIMVAYKQFAAKNTKIKYIAILSWVWSTLSGGLLAFLPGSTEKQCGIQYPVFWTENVVLHFFLQMSVIIPLIIITTCITPWFFQFLKISLRNYRSIMQGHFVIDYICLMVCWMPYTAFSNRFFFNKERFSTPGYINALMLCLVYTYPAFNSCYLLGLKYKGDRRRTRENLIRDVPKEMKYLNVKDKNLFNDIVRRGFYYSYLGKIMILGNEGVGKSAITANIIGRTPCRKGKPTEGIDVHICRAAVDMETMELIPKELDFKDIAHRNLIMETQNENEPQATLVQNQETDINHSKSNDEDNLHIQIPKAEDVPLDIGPFRHDAIDIIETEDNARTSVYIENDITEYPDAKNDTLWANIRRFFKQPMEDSITEDMILEGMILAGKKGVHLMKEAPVTILDFAGQRVFYSTHQCFLTYRGVYVLAVNGSFGLDIELSTDSIIPGRHGKPTTRAYIMFWVSSILTYSKGRSKRFPKIVICCTHKDLVQEDKVEEQRAYLYSEIGKMFCDTPAMAHLEIKQRLFFNAMDPQDPEIKTLKETLANLITNQPSWGEKLPKAWIYLEMVINQKSVKGKSVLHMAQLERINSENPFQCLTKKDLGVFLKIHHSQGDIIHFPLPGLRDHIIISPVFIIDALRCIITDKMFCGGQRLLLLTSQNNNGIIEKDEITRIWKSRKEFRKHLDFLIALMCYLDIFAEPRMYHPEKGYLIPSGFYFVPSLVTKEDNSSFTKQENLDHRSMGLSFTFHSTILPSAIGYRFISCCTDMWDVKEYESQRLLFSGMVVVVIKQSLLLLVQVKEQRIDVFLVHDTSRQLIEAEMASSIRQCLDDTLFRISDSYRKLSGEDDSEDVPYHIEYTCFNVQAPCYCPKMNDWVCSRHGNNLPASSFTKWFVERTVEYCSHDCQGVNVKELRKRPSEAELGKLAVQFTWDDMRGILIHLGMKNHEIEATRCDYEGNIRNVMFLCLRQWRMKTPNGTLEDIYKVIQTEELNTHTLCQVFKDKPVVLQFVILEKEPTDKHLDTIATHVINESLLMAVYLGVDALYWLELKADGNKIVNINRQILRKWRKNHTGKPKIRDLAQALSNIGIDVDALLSGGY